MLKEPLKNGLNYSKENFGAGIKFVNVSDIFCPAVINTTKLDRINVSQKDVEKYQLKTGDILIVRSSLKREGVAYPALFNEDEEPVVFCGFLIRIRPDKEKVEPLYLLNYLRSSIARERLIGDSGTVTITNVDQGTLLSFNIPLPPLPDQHHIASKLQELMQEISNLQSAIRNQQSALDALPSAYLREVFESEEAKKWERKRLGEVCEVCQYGLTATATNDKGFPYIRITDIDDLGNIKLDAIKFISCDGNTYKKYALKEGDILFARSGSIGRTFLYNGTPENAIFASYLIRFRIKQEIINPSYLFYYAHSPEYYKFIEEKKHTVSQPNINAEEYKSLLIPIPPISVQRRIAFDLKEKMTRVEKLQSTISILQSAIDALPQAFLKKAFTGEL